MKRVGIEGIYLGGWATSAKGSVTEDPGPDLASYPLSQVPDEAAPIVRALLTADRNQRFARSRMTEAQRARHPRGRLPAVHHRRRRHRPRRRRARAQPGPPLRRGRRARLPHRGPEAGRQEVRPPGRQGAGRRGRADQAPQRRALPARRHEGARDHRRPHRRRVGDVPRRPRRRARPARSSSAPPTSSCRPTRSATSPSSSGCASWASTTRAAHLLFQDLRRRVRGGRRLARADGRAARRSRTSVKALARREGPALEAAARQDRDALPGGLAGRGQPQDLPAGGGRRDPVPQRARASASR